MNLAKFGEKKTPHFINEYSKKSTSLMTLK